MRDEISALMIGKSADVFGVPEEQLEEETRFADLNAKSMQLVQLVTCLEDSFDVEIPFMTFNRMQTIREAVDYVLELVEE